MTNNEETATGVK